MTTTLHLVSGSTCDQFPQEEQERADQKFELLKENPRHLALRLKKGRALLVGTREPRFTGAGPREAREPLLVLDWLA